MQAAGFAAGGCGFDGQVGAGDEVAELAELGADVGAAV